jgi:hypothetical protein
LKEITSLLELALWKARISSLDQGKSIDGGNKKMKIDPSEFQLQCRISCGADQVIENVLPYLLPPDFVLSIDDSSDEDDDEEEDDGNLHCDDNLSDNNSDDEDDDNSDNDNNEEENEECTLAKRS